MPYSSREDVEYWGQFNSSDFGDIPSDWDYTGTLERAIKSADAEIDNYCRVPEGFFVAGGVVRQDEYHNGKDVPSGHKPLLRSDYIPVLNVVKLEYLESGSWVTKTEGNSSDYVVLDEGIILITLPNRTDYKNIRLTYKCGYTATPSEVTEISARLAAETLNRIKVNKIARDVLDENTYPTESGRTTMTVSTPIDYNALSKATLTDDLKAPLNDYRLLQTKVYRG